MNRAEDLVVIEKVNAETFGDFLFLISKLAEYEKLTPPDDDAKVRLQRDCLGEAPKYWAFLGRVDGKAVAYVIYFFTYSSFLALPTLYVEDIFVLEEYRRRGIGGRMFDFLAETAKREGCGRVEFTVLKWNKPAQAFYKKKKAKCLEWFFYRLAKEDF